MEFDTTTKVGNEYYMTLPLMEMLFHKKLPTEEDLLITTQSAYKYNGKKQGPKGSRSSKYVGLISEFVKKEGGRLDAKRSPSLVNQTRSGYVRRHRPWNQNRW